MFVSSSEVGLKTGTLETDKRRMISVIVNWASLYGAKFDLIKIELVFLRKVRTNV